MGSARPSIAPTAADQGPAQITVSLDVNSPWAVPTPTTVLPRVRKASSGVSSRITAPRRRAALANP